jgi:predicted nucleic acid-binding protein
LNGFLLDTNIALLSLARPERISAAARAAIEQGPNVLSDQLAVTALEHDLTVVTRNVRHFEGLGVAIFDPWEMP